MVESAREGAREQYQKKRGTRERAQHERAIEGARPGEVQFDRPLIPISFHFHFEFHRREREREEVKRRGIRRKGEDEFYWV